MRPDPQGELRIAALVRPQEGPREHDRPLLDLLRGDRKLELERAEEREQQDLHPKISIRADAITQRRHALDDREAVPDAAPRAAQESQRAPPHAGDGPCRVRDAGPPIRAVDQ